MPYQIISYKSITIWKQMVYNGQGTVYGSTFRRILDDDNVRGYQLSYVEADKFLIHLFVDVVIEYSDICSYETIEKFASLDKQAWEIIQIWLNEQDIALTQANVYLPDLEKIIRWKEIAVRPDFLAYDPVEIKITQA